MMCYKDKTFCSFYSLCKDGYKCDRALTPSVKKGAVKAELLISQFTSFPECFTVIWEDKK